MEKLLLSAVIVLATVWSVVVLSRGGAPERPGRGWARHPGTWLLVLVLLVYVNQVLFTVYVRREWGGDVSRLSRLLPEGWFALADLGWPADRFPAPELLPWTVMRAQSSLELAFGVLLHLLVCRWFGAEVYRTAVRARWAVSASFTVTFCLIEWELPTPYTTDDIVIRVLSGLVVPVLVSRLSEGPVGPPRLVPFVVSVAAMGALVLAVYDTALLYNLGDLDDWLPVAGAAAAVLAGARWWAGRPVAAAGPTTSAVTSSLGWFLVLFLVPSLPLRYGVNFGTTAVSLAAGLVITVAALWLGWPRALLGRLAAAAAVGVGGAVAGYFLASGYHEARLLAAAAGFLLAGGAVCAAADRWLTAAASDEPVSV
ncbi:hypothetical protein [Umezawaea sp. Da 62-37]|uniref:hypothetical protein n=1 Tax=Umezawaea sp. Da 62-37 TaxID=3075927 RepID=UPI0028F6FABE|nr:hypothetical protein [Umezawaea sp. Da 62-37]WNV88323.1 hypothetical protein RM788_08510 [Umezawaea sp. Da 62-37]